MIKKETLNYLARLYSYLRLLQGYSYSSLKKYWSLNLELAEIQAGQIFDKLICEYFDFTFIIFLMTYPMLLLKFPFLKKLKSISKSLLLELRPKCYVYP